LHQNQKHSANAKGDKIGKFTHFNPKGKTEPFMNLFPAYLVSVAENIIEKEIQ
jgi:hypothetical protein